MVACMRATAVVEMWEARESPKLGLKIRYVHEAVLVDLDDVADAAMMQTIGCCSPEVVDL